MVAVQLNQVSKKYGRRIGISGIDLTVNKGDIFGLIGPDSAGKTTILRILMNYIFPTDGEVTVFDEDVTISAKTLKKDMVYVPADIYFYHQMKIGKYIKLTLKAHKKKKSSHLTKLLKAFDVNLGERFEDMDKSDQKKAALATAIAIRPALLLLDEPTRGLEAKAIQILFDALKELQAHGTTVLITGRDADEYYGLCNRIAIIENGEITVDADAFFAENPECFADIDFSDTELINEVAELLTENDNITADEDEEDIDEEIDAYGDTIEIPVVTDDTLDSEAEAASEENAEIPIEDEAEQEEATEEVAEEETPAETEPEEGPAETVENREEAAEKDHDSKAAAVHKPQYDFSKQQETVNPEEPQKHKNITMKSIGFQRDAFTEIGAEVVSEEAGKIVMEYSGDLAALAKLLYDLDMDDICISSKDLQKEFQPFFEGGDAE